MTWLPLWTVVFSRGTFESAGRQQRQRVYCSPLLISWHTAHVLLGSPARCGQVGFSSRNFSKPGPHCLRKNGAHAAQCSKSTASADYQKRHFIELPCTKKKKQCDTTPPSKKLAQMKDWWRNLRAIPGCTSSPRPLLGSKMVSWEFVAKTKKNPSISWPSFDNWILHLAFRYLCHVLTCWTHF